MKEEARNAAAGTGGFRQDRKGKGKGKKGDKGKGKGTKGNAKSKGKGKAEYRAPSADRKGAKGKKGGKGGGKQRSASVTKTTGSGVKYRETNGGKKASDVEVACCFHYLKDGKCPRKDQTNGCPFAHLSKPQKEEKDSALRKELNLK